MAIEMPNFFEAAGVFDGFDPPTTPTGNPIFASNGVQPFNPATTPGDPVGGFTRLDIASYLIKLVRSIDVLECITVVTCFPTNDKLGRLCASVVAGEENEPNTDGTVLVLGAPPTDDEFFQLGVFRFLSDLSGTQALPAP